MGGCLSQGRCQHFPMRRMRLCRRGLKRRLCGVMENLKIVLGGIDMGLEHVMMARCYLTDFYRDYAQFNETYQSFFPKERRPARTTIGVTGLALHALVEIDFICKRPD